MAKASISKWSIGSPCRCYRGGKRLCIPACRCPSPRVSLPSRRCQQPASLRWDPGTKEPSSCGNASFDSFPKYGHIFLTSSPPKLQLGFQECEFPLCSPDYAVWRGGRAVGKLQRPRHGGTGTRHLPGHTWGTGSDGSPDQKSRRQWRATGSVSARPPWLLTPCPPPLRRHPGAQPHRRQGSDSPWVTALSQPCSVPGHLGTPEGAGDAPVPRHRR